MSWSVLPLLDPSYSREDSNPRRLWTVHGPVLAGLFGLLSLPPVTERTGVTPWEVATVIGPNLLLNVVGAHSRLPSRAPLRWATAAYVTNFTVSALFAFWTDHPATLLWGFFLLYAIIAAQAGRAALLAVGLVGALPFAVALGWSAVGTVPLADSAVPVAIVAAISLASYLSVASIQENLRAARARIAELERAAAADGERRRIARDLHDTVGATLTEAALWAEASAVGGAAGQTARERTQASTQEALSELRASVRALATEPGEPGSFEERVRPRLAGLCAASGSQLRLEVVGAGENTEPGFELHLGCIALEAVTNSVRHGRARTVDVRISLRNPPALAVSDDGRGFDPGRPATGHGLPSMRERSRLLGCELVVESAPDHGCRLEVRPATSAEAPREPAATTLAG